MLWLVLKVESWTLLNYVLWFEWDSDASGHAVAIISHVPALFLEPPSSTNVNDIFTCISLITWILHLYFVWLWFCFGYGYQLIDVLGYGEMAGIMSYGMPLHVYYSLSEAHGIFGYLAKMGKDLHRARLASTLVSQSQRLVPELLEDFLGTVAQVLNNTYFSHPGFTRGYAEEILSDRKRDKRVRHLLWGMLFQHHGNFHPLSSPTGQQFIGRVERSGVMFDGMVKRVRTSWRVSLLALFETSSSN